MEEWVGGITEEKEGNNVGNYRESESLIPCRMGRSLHDLAISDKETVHKIIKYGTHWKRYIQATVQEKRYMRETVHKGYGTHGKRYTRETVHKGNGIQGKRYTWETV